jgi:hypothetical protein
MKGAIYSEHNRINKLSQVLGLSSVCKPFKNSKTEKRKKHYVLFNFYNLFFTQHLSICIKNLVSKVLKIYLAYNVFGHPWSGGNLAIAFA